MPAQIKAPDRSKANWDIYREKKNNKNKNIRWCSVPDIIHFMIIFQCVQWSSDWSDRSLRLNELYWWKQWKKVKKFEYRPVHICCCCHYEYCVLSARWVHTLKYTFCFYFRHSFHDFSLISSPGLVGWLAGTCIPYDDRNLINIWVQRCRLFE